MAVSKAERRWSKEPRIATMLSVMVWLLSKESRMNEAFSFRFSIFGCSELRRSSPSEYEAARFSLLKSSFRVLTSHSMLIMGLIFD